VDLTDKGIDAGRAKLVAKESALNSKVTAILLNKNDLGDEGSADIANALALNRALVATELDDNGIGDAGSSVIASTLGMNSVLTKLSLNGNSISPVGATALGEALCTNSSLQFLGLGRNSIGSDGAVAIAQARKSNLTLSTLDIHSNSISDAGGMAILTVLKDYNCSLMFLNLDGNADMAPGFLSSIKGVQDSRRVLMFLLNHLIEPLEEGAIPLVVEAMHRGRIFRRETGLSDCDKRAGNAGFVFHLVRSAALGDSAVIKSKRNAHKRLKRG
jgi:Leucine Rich repeat